jgi:hypothetical protein
MPLQVRNSYVTKDSPKKSHVSRPFLSKKLSPMKRLPPSTARYADSLVALEAGGYTVTKQTKSRPSSPSRFM